MGRQIPCRRIREGEREWTRRQELRLLVLALVGIRRVGRAAAAVAAVATVLRQFLGALADVVLSRELGVDPERRRVSSVVVVFVFVVDEVAIAIVIVGRGRRRRRR
jgi:hypothetical protein